jgi:hypothetical protein
MCTPQQVGTNVYVDISFDDGDKRRNFKLFEDYYGRGDVESGWKEESA